jgi:ubiquinone/menaquinone biosynthesis C-methylase UbiE
MVASHRPVDLGRDLEGVTPARLGMRLIIMPSVTWNQDKWDRRYSWDDGGEEWSARWGGSLTQWRSCLWPRIAAFLPVRSLVEIAPGHGRWTQYLLPHADTYIGVDLAKSCVDACQERFAGTNAHFTVSDGRSLPSVADGSADLVFTFDSLVHAEADVISDYLSEFSRVLSGDGVAFVHHSNVGTYHATAALRDLIGRLAEPFPVARQMLGPAGIADWHNFRGRSMTADRFAQMSAEAGLSCIGQEIIPWASPLLIDCISVVTRPGSRWDRPLVHLVNRHFRAAARSSRIAARTFPQCPEGRGRARTSSQTRT